MKFVKRLLFVLLIVLIITLAGGYVWLRSTRPVYDGTLELKGLENKVGITYDEFGVPHIYASNAHDAYFALGHALSIIPTGQSGNIMSPHYADQAEMFVNGDYRIQYFNMPELKKKQVLNLIPDK